LGVKNANVCPTNTPFTDFKNEMELFENSALFEDTTIFHLKDSIKKLKAINVSSTHQ